MSLVGGGSWGFVRGGGSHPWCGHLHYVCWHAAKIRRNTSIPRVRLGRPANAKRHKFISSYWIKDRRANSSQPFWLQPIFQEQRAQGRNGAGEDMSTFRTCSDTSKVGGYVIFFIAWLWTKFTKPLVTSSAHAGTRTPIYLAPARVSLSLSKSNCKNNGVNRIINNKTEIRHGHHVIVNMATYWQ